MEFKGRKLAGFKQFFPIKSSDLNLEEKHINILEQVYLQSNTS